MQDTYKITRIAILLMVAASLVFGLYLLGRFLLGGTLVLDVSAFDMNQTQIFVNDQAQGLKGYNENTKKIRMSNVFGKKKIVIKSAGIKPFEVTEQVTFRSEREIKPAIEESTALEEAKSLAIDEPITEAHYDRTSDGMIAYLVFTTEANGEQYEASARFMRATGTWGEISHHHD